MDIERAHCTRTDSAVAWFDNPMMNRGRSNAFVRNERLYWFDSSGQVRHARPLRHRFDSCRAMSLEAPNQMVSLDCWWAEQARPMKVRTSSSEWRVSHEFRSRLTHRIGRSIVPWLQQWLPLGKSSREQRDASSLKRSESWSGSIEFVFSNGQRNDFWKMVEKAVCERVPIITEEQKQWKEEFSQSGLMVLS